jgi:hypothetical protein
LLVTFWAQEFGRELLLAKNAITLCRFGPNIALLLLQPVVHTVVGTPQVEHNILGPFGMLQYVEYVALLQKWGLILRRICLPKILFRETSKYKHEKGIYSIP